MNCTAVGDPTPTVEWYIDGKPFKGTIFLKLVEEHSVSIFPQVQDHQWRAYVLFLGRKFQMKMGFY